MKQLQKFSDLRVFVVNRRGCYALLHTLRHFNVFTKTLFRRAIHKLIILHHFNVFTGTLYRRAITVYLGKYSQRIICYSGLLWFGRRAFHVPNLMHKLYYNVFRKQFGRNKHFSPLNLGRLKLRSASVKWTLPASLNTLSLIWLF